MFVDAPARSACARAAGAAASPAPRGRAHSAGAGRFRPGARPPPRDEVVERQVLAAPGAPPRLTSSRFWTSVSMPRAPPRSSCRSFAPGPPARRPGSASRSRRSWRFSDSAFSGLLTSCAIPAPSAVTASLRAWSAAALLLAGHVRDVLEAEDGAQHLARPSPHGRERRPDHPRPEGVARQRAPGPPLEHVREERRPVHVLVGEKAGHRLQERAPHRPRPGPGHPGQRLVPDHHAPRRDRSRRPPAAAPPPAPRGARRSPARACRRSRTSE